MTDFDNLTHDVFISYSHKDADIAEKISRRIRLYKAPRHIGIINRKLNVFRDTEHLTASPDLSDELKKQLKASKWLALICSPSSADADWVNREVEFFLQCKEIKFIIFVHCDGEFQACLPASLKQKVKDPLYINLKGANCKTFRTESLRLIAAIHDVSFILLRREDQVRRQRKIRQIVAASIVFAFFLVSLYLILGVSPVHWQEIDEPIIYGRYPVKTLPVHQVAINRKYPDQILFLKRNSFWYGEKLYNIPPEKTPEGFQSLDSIVTIFSKNKNGILPIAQVNLEINYNDEFVAKFQMEISAILDVMDQPRYIRSISYHILNGKSVIQTIKIPPSLVPEKESPLDIGRPVEKLISENVLNNNSIANGTITNLFTGMKGEVTYNLNPDDVFDDGKNSKEKIWGKEYWIYTQGFQTRELVLGYPLDSIDNCRLFWDKIEASDEWVKYKEPVQGKTYSYYPTEGQADKFASRISKDIFPFENTKLLEKLLIKERIDLIESIDVSLFTTQSVICKTDIIKLEGFELNRHDEPTPIGITWLIRSSQFINWKPINLPVERILGIWSLDSLGNDLLLLSNDKGYYKTNDGGLVWTPANYNENGFSDGSSVKTLILGKEIIYSLIDRGESYLEGKNPLYRIESRNWIERWRAGLIQLLK
jgi:hypothetical protein